MHGTAAKPRISVHRSNKHVYVQAIDDDAAKTLVSSSTKTLAAKKAATKREQAAQVGEAVGKQLTQHKISQAVFDRGSFRYHGRVKEVAEAIRAQGITV